MEIVVRQILDPSDENYILALAQSKSCNYRPGPPPMTAWKLALELFNVDNRLFSLMPLIALMQWGSILLWTLGSLHLTKAVVLYRFCRK